MPRTVLKERAKKTLLANLMLMAVYFLPSIITGIYLFRSIAEIQYMIRGVWIGFDFFTPLAISVLLMLAEYVCVKAVVVADRSDLGFATVIDSMSVNNFVNYVLAEILVGVRVFLWSLLFWFPGIYKAYEYSMVKWAIAADKSMTVKGAFARSRLVMHHHRFDYFVLDLSFILWNIASSLTAGLVGVFLNPYKALTSYEFYKARLMAEGVYLDVE